MSDKEINRPPFYIWIIAFVLMHLSSEYSIFFLYTPGTADVYLTFAVGVVLIYWLGPGVLILSYINALINCHLWGHENLLSWPFFSLPEPIFLFLSWFLFIRFGKGKFWLPDLNSVVKFLILGISIPLTAYMLILKHLLVYYNELDQSELWSSILASWLGDFMPTIIVSLPILYYVSGPFLRWMGNKDEFAVHNSVAKSKFIYGEMAGFFIVIMLMSYFMNFNRYWYLYGLISLVISVRHGFGLTAIANLFILTVIYLIPASFYRQTANLYFSQNELIEIYLGINLLSLFSIICGRVISDYRNAQKSIRVEMEKVEKINTELDRFVYSVSHDLIAPLKSIKGLTNLMKRDHDKGNSVDYVSKIEESATKLEEFISEILDYSRSNRTDLKYERVDLIQLIEENISNHRYLEGFEHIEFDLSAVTVREVRTDSLRLRIILNNLISNAIKFSNDAPDSKIKFSSVKKNGNIEIAVEDNGYGIPPEFKDKIFDMFFRASHDKSGSGLGLFIAREAAKKMHGDLRVESVQGEWSRFILTIPT
jgi:two-component system, sensor histidine kinase